MQTNPEEASGRHWPASRPATQEERSQASVLRALQTLSAGNRTLLRALDEQELLHDMCRVIVEKGDYRIACVGYATYDERKSIRWMASVGTDLETMAALNLTWGDDVLGGSVTGTAIRSGLPVVGRLLSDPLYAGPAFDLLREYADKVGFSSLTALPLRAEEQVFGGLLITAAEPKATHGNISVEISVG